MFPAVASQGAGVVPLEPVARRSRAPISQPNRSVWLIMSARASPTGCGECQAAASDRRRREGAEEVKTRMEAGEGFRVGPLKIRTRQRPQKRRSTPDLPSEEDRHLSAQDRTIRRMIQNLRGPFRVSRSGADILHVLDAVENLSVILRRQGGLRFCYSNLVMEPGDARR